MAITLFGHNGTPFRLLSTNAKSSPGRRKLNAYLGFLWNNIRRNLSRTVLSKVLVQRNRFRDTGNKGRESQTSSFCLLYTVERQFSKRHVLQLGATELRELLL